MSASEFVCHVTLGIHVIHQLYNIRNSKLLLHDTTLTLLTVVELYLEDFR